MARKSVEGQGVTMKMKPKKCIICGNTFVPRSGKQIMCSPECRHERYLKQQRDYQKRTKKKKNSMSTLAEINERARKLGMTYGKYIFMTEVNG